MKASVSAILCGCNFADDAFSNVATSGPCALMQLWIEMPPGANPSALASYTPCTSPMSSLMTLRWNHGGRNVASATSQRGGKMTKSQFATPGWAEGDVNTVKIDGSGWSKLTVLITMKRARSYLYGA